MTKLLMSPSKTEPVAELIPGKEIIVKNNVLLKLITESGITVTPEFKTKHQMKEWQIFITDNDKALFAKAFEEVYFVHGLQQQGYYWKDKG